jgi:hypothetical protein
MHTTIHLHPDPVERHLIILKYVNQVPSFASCSNCQHKFFTPPSHRFDRAAALDYLDKKFLLHKCKQSRLGPSN